MATKPSDSARWAKTAGGADAANITVPASGQKDTGWTTSQAPPSGYFNWWMNIVYQWVLYIKDAIFTADAGGGLDGVKATGDGAGAGVFGTGGATGPGGKFAGLAGGVGRGAINLVPQAAPGAPVNGDAWIDTGTNTARAQINGAAQTLGPMAVLSWACGTLNGAGVVTKYLQHWSAEQATGAGLYSTDTGDQVTKIVIPSAGTISKLAIYTPLSENAISYTFTLRKNGVDQAVTATFTGNGAAQTGFDTTHSFAVAAGDVITCKGVEGAGGTFFPLFVVSAVLAMS